MSPDRWRQVEDLYHSALERSPAHRAAFLAQAAVDEDLRREVESLLEQNSPDGSMLERPVWEDLPDTAGTGERPVDSEERFPPGAMIANRYCIVASLGRGGMGEVYRATDLVLKQPVALKFLNQSLAGDPLALDRLFNEVRLARQVSHTNVCRVYDVVESGGLHCLTMEYVDGEDLRSLINRIGRVPAGRATEIARRLCAGVLAAHQRGVLHRDLKPSNIM